MLFRMTELKNQVSPVLERALDVLFILHADHEQNCSTNAMRGIGSSHVDPTPRWPARQRPLRNRCTAANDEAVLRMLAEIGTVQNVPGFIKRVKVAEAG